jgi:hypothetical protein
MRCEHWPDYPPEQRVMLAGGAIRCPVCADRCRGCDQPIPRRQLDEYGFCRDCADPELLREP